MCIAIVKKSGAVMPDKQTLKQCFENNPHGCGFMFSREGKVHIHKGYMSFKRFWQALNEFRIQPDEAAALHFRWATAGSISPENCHPFPLLEDIPSLKARKLTVEQGMIHNGVFTNFPGDKKWDLSDTQNFVMSFLADPLIRRNLSDKRIQTLIESVTIGSKVAVLNGNNSYVCLGTGWHENEGVIYSNDGYKIIRQRTAVVYSTYNQAWKGYYDYDYDYDYDDNKRYTEYWRRQQSSVLDHCPSCESLNTLRRWNHSMDKMMGFCDDCGKYFPLPGQKEEPAQEDTQEKKEAEIETEQTREILQGE